MKILVRLALAGAIAAALFVVGAGSSPAPALASSCSGVSCAGHDPDAYGCTASSSKSAAVVISGSTVANVTNMYSGACNANWTNATLTSAGINSGYRIQDIITTTDVNGNREGSCALTASGQSNGGSIIEDCGGLYNGSLVLYTDMVDGHNLTYSYVYVYDRNGHYVAYAQVSQ